MADKQLLINYHPGEECRIAVVEKGKLQEFYQERASNESHIGNIYKGRVSNVEPSIQAAFIDFGINRNGFLHISDLHPKYFPGESKEETERVGKKTPKRDRPPIQQCLKPGQTVMVQVLKEGIGTKGPTLTSYLSIPGRYLVMMPDMERLGVSRSTEDDDLRQKMKKLLDQLNPPKEFGFIVRTAGLGQTKAELKRDLNYLQRLWKDIDKKLKSNIVVGELYAESDLVVRTMRDVFSSDFDQIIVDNESAARRARDFLAIASPRSTSKVLLYQDKVPLMFRYGVEEQLRVITHREVPLPSGGSLVIDPTEALVAIDVNSGKMRDNKDAETTALRTNREAADEVCRQLRLRDLGGVVVVDMIDMNLNKHRREIESRIRENLKLDRARTRVNPISQFGLLEMTRQRMRPGLKKSLSVECVNCGGSGRVKNPEIAALEAIRLLSALLHHESAVHADLIVSPDIAFYILNGKRSDLVTLEQSLGKTITVRVGGQSGDHMEAVIFDRRGNKIQSDKWKFNKKPKLKSADELLEPVAIEADDLEDLDEEELLEESEDQQADAEETTEDAEAEDKPKRRRRRGGRRRNRRKKKDDGDIEVADGDDQTEASDSEERDGDQDTASEQVDASADSDDKSAEASSEAANDDEAEAKPKRRRRKRGRKKSAAKDADKNAESDQAADTSEPADAEPVTVAEGDSPNDNAEAETKVKPRSKRRKVTRRSSALSLGNSTTGLVRKKTRGRGKRKTAATSEAPTEINTDIPVEITPEPATSTPQAESSE